MRPNYFDNKERLQDVVLIRTLAIIVVVAFHAYYMMMTEGHFPESAQLYRDMYQNFLCMALQFKMPLFIFISGYLFSHLENHSGKYSSFKGLCLNKFKRLIIPFFVFSTIFMLSIKNFSWTPYYSWAYDHLWFIPMLFWCFIFTRIQSYSKYSNKWWWKIGILVSFFLLNLHPEIDLPLLGLPSFIRWNFWFYLGYQIYLYRNEIYHLFYSHKLTAGIFLLTSYIVCVLAMCALLNDNDNHTWYSEIGNISIVLFIWFATNYLLFNTKLSKGLTKFENINKYSYGIYVFHNWLQPFMISSTSIALFGLDIYALRHPILFPLAFTISSFILSYLLTWLVLKSKTGRFLLG